MYYKEEQNNKEDDLFMKEFKFYRKFETTSLDFKNKTTDHDHNIIVLDNLKHNQGQLKRVELKENDDEVLRVLKKYGLKPRLADWCCFESSAIEGLYLISNPFLPGHQRFFVTNCLTKYQARPNKTNLDLHVAEREENLWQNVIRYIFHDFLAHLNCNRIYTCK